MLVDKTVELESVSEEDFQQYIESAIKEYAGEKVMAGNWNRDEAYNLSKKAFSNFLPQGRETPGHSVMTIIESMKKDKVGILWVEWKNKEWNSAYIWDIVIFEKFRRNGYGFLTLKQLEIMAKEHGSESIVLHVFGHNKPARALYDSLGYYPTNIIMRKDLGKKL